MHFNGAILTSFRIMHFLNPFCLLQGLTQHKAK